MKIQRLSRLVILEYALTGACTDRGVGSEHLPDEEMDQLNADIEELEKRIKREKEKQDGPH